MTQRAAGPAIREPYVLAAIVALGFALRYALIGVLPLWFDEAFSLDVARKSVPEIWRFLPAHDAHPIGYYALLSLWIHAAGTSLVAIRLPSLLLGLLAIVLTWRLGRDMFSVPVGLAAAALVAVNPFQIVASDEARMYPLLECLGLAATWLVWRAAAAAATRWWAAYGVAAALLLYTSYYGVLLLAAHAVWLVASRPRRPMRGPAIAAAVAALGYLPWLLARPGLPGLPWRQPITPNDVADLIAMPLFGDYTFGFGAYQFSGGGRPWLLALLLIPWAALVAAGAGVLGRLRRSARSLAALAWILPVAAAIGASLAAGERAAFPRHLVFVEPYAAFFVAAAVVGVAAVPRRGRALLALAPAALLLLVFALPALDRVERDPALRPYRYDLAARFVRDVDRPGDVVLFFPGQTYLPFRYYYDPPERLELVVYEQGWSGAALRAPIRQVAAGLAGRGVRRLWLVSSPPWPADALEDLLRSLRVSGFAQGPTENFNSLWVTPFVRTGR